MIPDLCPNKVDLIIRSAAVELNTTPYVIENILCEMLQPEQKYDCFFPGQSLYYVERQGHQWKVCYVDHDGNTGVLELMPCKPFGQCVQSFVVDWWCTELLDFAPDEMFNPTCNRNSQKKPLLKSSPPSAPKIYRTYTPKWHCAISNPAGEFLTVCLVN